MKNGESRQERLEKAREFFRRRWDEIDTVIDYNSDWEQPFMQKETLLGAMLAGHIEYSLMEMLKDEQALSLKPGQTAKLMDDLGRKFIIISTRLGPWLFFVVSKNVNEGKLGDLRTKRLKQYQLSEIKYTRSELALYLGSPNGLYDGNRTVARNVGERMELIFEMMQDPTKEPLEDHYYIRRNKDKK
jgi:hypothetical protein